MVRAHCVEISATAACTDTKVGSTILVRYAKARYKSKLSFLSLRELKEIDLIFYAFYTKPTKYMKTFPYD